MAAGRPPDVLCDNSPDKWGQRFRGIPCVAPGDIPAAAEDTLVVLCLRNYEAPLAQLRALGYRHVRLACFDRGYHRLSALRALDETLPDTPPPLSPRGRRALVTGATRGIGRQIAQALAQAGTHLICHGRTEAAAIQACRAVASYGIEALPVAADLADAAATDRLCRWLADLAPPVDILYNNAGISPPCPEGFWKQDGREFASCYAVNAIAPIRICQTLIPGMRERGFGRIVNVSSSIQKRPDEMAYACSKAALDKFVHDLAPTLAGSGVMMSLLDPGWLRTDMGGANAPHAVDSVLPGALLGAVVDGDVNGRWISAQDYRGLSLEAAIHKAFFIRAC
ncbi:SDR family NAD(P)-dependent oxidoreductase [Pseudothauera nasutitermitis]|uniref:SDR family NAD(P)-dependent oxidoreductase n=2 Tax=Pseudothauera nasutitermitis TaxID=2565930 RepID=A0A4S4B0E7_9RHOO|nr:SDR family NAD(P)-dependent oxidoreductase [Pseudothauera nasutitermitis]